MLSFKQYIIEGYKNLFTPADKQKYAEVAYAQIQKAYAKIGGMSGSGFDSAADMVAKIPMWKLRFGANGELLAAAYYKDKSGRKIVAITTDGSARGKEVVTDIMLSDITQERSYGEISSAALSYLVSILGYAAVKKYAIHPKDLEKLSPDIIHPAYEHDMEVKKHPELAHLFYHREIAGVRHTKIALGKPQKEIT